MEQYIGPSCPYICRCPVALSQSLGWNPLMTCSPGRKYWQTCYVRAVVLCKHIATFQEKPHNCATCQYSSLGTLYNARDKDIHLWQKTPDNGYSITSLEKVPYKHDPGWGTDNTIDIGRKPYHHDRCRLTWK
jgi:hypothetical protein